MRGFIRCALRSALLLPFLVAGACRTLGTGGADASWTLSQADQIQGAGQQLGIPVRTTHMLHFAQDGTTFFTAPAANLETIPATELHRGISLGVAYLDAPGQSLPAGFYGLKVFGDPQGVGPVQGRLQWIDADGGVAAESSAMINVWSMALPAPRTDAAEETSVTIDTGEDPFPLGPAIVMRRICLHCSNGMRSCFEIPSTPGR